jgi:hypothetical protein
MKLSRNVAVFAGLLFAAAAAVAQQPNQPELRIDSVNRTLTVNAEGEITVEPEIAILHIGFETQLGDAKSVYAEGSRTSNAIVAALKETGIPESSIRSETQHLDRDYAKPHKFKLIQRWTVKAPADRAAEILDIAITAGATSSGDIEWTVKDEQALEDQALDKATSRAKSNAAVLAKGMGVRLGALLYVSNQLTTPRLPIRAMASPMALARAADASQPLSIEPQKVIRQASVYAVFAIE